jgi:hypothetical protein
MSIGDIKPQVGEAFTSSTTHSMKPNVDEEEDKEVPPTHPRVQVPSTRVQDQVDPIVQSSSQVQDNHAQPPQAPQDVLQVRHGRISKDHSIDQIIGSPSKGVRTRSKRQASFVEHYSFVSFVEPMCVEEALKDPNWLLAMHEELNNFTRNDVWVLEPPPKSKNIIGTKWVFHNKEDEHGVVVHNKARLVVKGYSQVEGLDFGDTFAPVARLEVIWLLLAYSSLNDIKLYQMDVKSAFLNGEINELVYVEQPPEFEDPRNPNHVYVYRLKKALYGLKQAPRAWYERLSGFLIKQGFKRDMVDTTLFTKDINGDLFICQIYVDDIRLN